MGFWLERRLNDLRGKCDSGAAARSYDFVVSQIFVAGNRIDLPAFWADFRFGVFVDDDHIAGRGDLAAAELSQCQGFKPGGGFAAVDCFGAIRRGGGAHRAGTSQLLAISGGEIAEPASSGGAAACAAAMAGIGAAEPGAAASTIGVAATGLRIPH